MTETMTKAKTKQEGREEFSAEVLDTLLQGVVTEQDLLGEGGTVKRLTKALLERVLQAELSHHLGYDKHESKGRDGGNSRNGFSEKTVRGEFGQVPIAIPRDREGSFEPLILPKGKSRLGGLDEKIISLYARGMSTRDITSQLRELYRVEVSAELISQVTESVMEEVKSWQSRPLDALYPIVWMDAIHVKIRHQGQVKNKAVYLALGVNLEGQKDLLGLWIAETEGSKFWLSVLTELKARGVQDIFIACIDGLTGFAEAIETAFTKTQVQQCVVHMVRNSLAYVNYKDRKKVAADLRSIYAAPTEQSAELQLEAFATKWDATYPYISKSWRQHWTRLTPCFQYPADIRRVVYTTNTIESVNASLRKVMRQRGAFPSDDSVHKVMYLALRNIKKRWNMPVFHWSAALNHFRIFFDDRFPTS